MLCQARGPVCNQRDRLEGIIIAGKRKNDPFSVSGHGDGRSILAAGLASLSPESSSIRRPDRTRSASVRRVILYCRRNSMLRVRSTVREALLGTPDRVSNRSTPDSRVNVFSVTGRRVIGGLLLCFTWSVSWPS